MFTQFHKSCAYAQAKKLNYLMENLMRSKFFILNIACQMIGRVSKRDKTSPYHRTSCWTQFLCPLKAYAKAYMYHTHTAVSVHIF